MKKILLRLLCTILVVTGTSFVLTKILSNLNYGLDLAGGFEVLYKIESLDGQEVTDDMVTSTYKVLDKRINNLGISEPNIEIEGNNRIRIQLAGVKDASEARDTLSKVASLTFRDVNDNKLMDSSVLVSGGASLEQYNGKYVISLKIADNDKFAEVTKQISESEQNYMIVWLDFDENTDSFYVYDEEGNITGVTECGSLANTSCLSAASVEESLTGDVMISSSNGFEKEEAQSLVDLINSGGLTTKLTEISSRQVDASFGKDSLSKMFTASLVGIILIIAFMIIVYRFAGFISSLGIIVYLCLTLGLFWVFGGVLTLPGIAALVIGVGMAVDSSIINYARIKDELKKGNGMQMAFKNGNKTSLLTIIDSNVTTLLVAIILFIFGESSVKGFATMLIFSIIVTLFVMVFLVRKTLKYFIQTDFFNDKERNFIGYKDKKKKEHKFDFIKNKKIIYIIPLILIVVGILSLCFKGLNIGVDFKGGSSITVLENETVLDEKELKNDLAEFNYNVYSIEKVDDTITLKINEDLDADEIEILEEYFLTKYNSNTEIGSVSNLVSKELLKNAILSLVIASIGIIIYISIRFKFSYALCSIIALFHDIFIVFLVFSLFGIEISSIFIAAILSIIGYSINNTIVVFDRIKEAIGKEKLKNEEELKEKVNNSLNNVFARSMYTTLTTIFAVGAFIFLGARSTFNFNMALLIGFLAGTFSSLCLCGCLWYDMEKNKIGKKEKKKWYENTKKEKEELRIKGINS